MIFFAAASSSNLFSALGINWKLLIEQAIAFVILMLILAKWVYPAIIKAIDDRRKAIEAGLKEAKESHEALEKAQDEIAKLLEDARNEADDIIARSHQEAAAMVTDAEDKARARAEQIITDARTQLDLDIRKARQALKSETARLVARATGHIIHEKLDERKDAQLIDTALTREDMR